MQLCICMYMYIPFQILFPYRLLQNIEYSPLCCTVSPGCLFYILLFSHSIVSNSVTPWTAVHQTSLSFTISQSLLKLISIESVMPSNHLILYHPLYLLPSIFPSIRVLSNESTLSIEWPKHWSFIIVCVFVHLKLLIYQPSLFPFFNHNFFLCVWIYFCFLNTFICICIFFFNFTSKGYHMTFVFLCLTSLSMKISRSCKNIFFFLNWGIASVLIC